MVAYGPLVMNTMEKIKKAIETFIWVYWSYGSSMED
nr:pirin-like C-terminal cupin domain-containing protein [Alkalihalobacillus sp. AL-G]